MPKPQPNGMGLSDPLRLTLVHALFSLADAEFKRQTAAGFAAGSAPNGRAERGPGATRGEAEQLAAAFRSHLASLSPEELAPLRTKLARNLLIEIDRRMAAPGTPPGERHDLTQLLVEPSPPATDAGAGKPAPRVALVSLPWMSPAMPSIQLATLAAALEHEGLAADVFELYVDYAAQIGLNLYNLLGNLLGYVPEWVFARHYYGPEHGDYLAAMLDQHPLTEIPWPELADVILGALEPVTRTYLDEVVEQIDWSRYDILGCSLTISQLGASMAFVRRVKLRHPEIKVVFGGSQCAGVMGRAILRICPYVDVVAHVEGELVLPELVRRLRAMRNGKQDGEQPLNGLAGVSYRTPGGAITGEDGTPLYRPAGARLPLNYDAYFRRLVRLGLLEHMNPWLPIESSRGCWYGQKVQCTFCGLHEIMEFRAWEADAVLAELERLQARYGGGRFYCMDLILPREFLHTLLPEITRRGHDWMFFYEIKANMRREELEVLAAAGVRWVQPGIESLDADLLHLMRKGVSPLQNILLLKWCQELGIFCGWNLLFGLPGEHAESYARMAAIIPKLVHLQPPTGGGQFQLHRFSPYFEHPEAYGIRWTGAHHMFRYAFPLAKTDLDDLVYLHDFDFEPGVGPVDSAEVQAAVAAWRRVYRQGAALRMTVHDDGSSEIVDGRQVAQPARMHQLAPAETALYLFLDAGVGEKALHQKFAHAHPEEEQVLAQCGGIEAQLARWRQDDLVLVIDGKVVSLALQGARMEQGAAKATRGAPINLPYEGSASVQETSIQVASIEG